MTLPSRKEAAASNGSTCSVGAEAPGVAPEFDFTRLARAGSCFCLAAPVKEQRSDFVRLEAISIVSTYGLSIPLISSCLASVRCSISSPSSRTPFLLYSLECFFMPTIMIRGKPPVSDE